MKLADKEITIKVSTEADTKELYDLKDVIEDLSNPQIEIETHVDEAEIRETQEDIDELDNETVTVDLDIPLDSIDEAQSGIEGLNQSIDAGSESSENLGNNLDFETSSIDSASDSAWQLSRSMDDATSSAGNFNEILQSALYLDIANQIGAIGDQAEIMALQVDNTSISIGQLSTNTGIAEGELRNMISYISNETFPQSEAIAYANALNQMGVEANKLADSATNMDKINDATGIGYQKVIGLTQGLRGLGITADSLPSSFNAIAYAQANVTGGTDTLSVLLKTQAGTLNEYGWNVDQVVVAMGRLSEMGYSQRKIGSELSSILKENNGDIRGVERALGLQAGALSNASQYTQQYEGRLESLANEEMEHKTLTERLGAVYEDLTLQLEPVLSPLMSFVGLVGSIGQGALAINSILTLAETFGILKTATISETVAQWNLNLAFLSNPVTWLVVALLILAGALIYCYYNCEDFRNIVNSMGESIIGVAQIVYNAVVGTIQWLISEFENFTNIIGLDTNNWIQAILGFLMFLPLLPLRLGQVFLDSIMKTIGFGDNFTNGLISRISSAINSFTNIVQGIPNALQSCLNWAYNLVMNHPIVQALQWLGNKLVWAFSKLGLGQGSPGDIYGAMENELNWTKDMVKSSNLSAYVGQLGKDISDKFGSPKLTIGNEEIINSIIDVTGTNKRSTGDTIINVYGDVDNDNRIKQIIEAVRRELNWNNVNAGRSI